MDSRMRERPARRIGHRSEMGNGKEEGGQGGWSDEERRDRVKVDQDADKMID